MAARSDPPKPDARQPQRYSVPDTHGSLIPRSSGCRHELLDGEPTASGDLADAAPVAAAEASDRIEEVDGHAVVHEDGFIDRNARHLAEHDEAVPHLLDLHELPYLLYLP